MTREEAVRDRVKATIALTRIAQHDAVQRMRPASLFNLQIALQALETDGIGGTIVLRIPTKAGTPMECEYHSALLAS